MGRLWYKRCMNSCNYKFLYILFLILGTVFLKPNIVKAFDPDMRNVSTPASITNVTPSQVPVTPTPTPVQTQSGVSTLNPSPPVTSTAVVVSPTETETLTNNPVTATVIPEVLAYSTDNNKNIYLIIVMVLSLIGTGIGSLITIRRLKSDEVQK